MVMWNIWKFFCLQFVLDLFLNVFIEVVVVSNGGGGVEERVVQYVDSIESELDIRFD